MRKGNMDGENGGSPKKQVLYEKRSSGLTANSLNGALEETTRQHGEMELRVRCVGIMAHDAAMENASLASPHIFTSFRLLYLATPWATSQ